MPNLASRVLGLSLRSLRVDWLALHGHDLLLAETFVDPQRYRGICYRAANWLELGATQGFGRVRGGAIGYRAHGQPKRVWVYPLQADARQQLTAAEPRPTWIPWRHKMQLSAAQLESLYQFLQQVPDPRRQRGKRYSLTIVIAARLAGADTLTDISDFGPTSTGVRWSASAAAAGLPPAKSRRRASRPCTTSSKRSMPSRSNALE